MAELPDACRASAARLEAAFEMIRVERMHDVPILNAALKVEAVGLRPWNGCVLGALVTPWFINLILLPGEGPWRSVRLTDSVWYAFPSGRFQFIAFAEPTLGQYHACSLLSPVLEFADHETAREMARVAVESLFDPDAPRRSATAAAEGRARLDEPAQFPARSLRDSPQ
jgi:[NiFe] hydrogenase assembly HybE family chaperone